MFKACIFDLDGTLANTLESIAYFANTALGRVGLAPIDAEKYRIFVGNGRDKLIHRVLEYRGADTEENFKIVGECYDKLYEQDPGYLVTYYEGTKELIRELADRGIKLAILSNKPDDMTKAVAKGLYGDVFEIVQGQLPDVPKKPDPTAVNDLMQRMAVSPTETLYIGDSGVDMETGRNASLITAGVTWGFRGEEELVNCGAVHIVHNATELKDVILK